MKKNKLLLVSVLSLFLTYNASAQSNKYDWFLNVGGGSQLLFSSDAENLNFKQRLTPSFSLSAGKWVTPLLGFRLQAGAYSLNGYSTTKGIYLADPLDNGSVYGQNDPVRKEVTIHPDGSYRHYLRYANIHADLQLNLFNLIKRWESSKWDVIPAVGLGYFRTFAYKGTPAVNSLSTNFSLMVKRSITERIDANMEIATAVLPDIFDGRISGKTYENTLGLTLGLSYRFQWKSGPRKVKGIVPVQLVRDTVKVEKVVEKIVEKPVTIIENASKAPFCIASIRFNLAKSNPITGQEVQFVNIANYLKNNPKSKVLLEGYGDRETGSAEENFRISTMRVENVRKVLMDQYHISESALEIKAVGSQEQPYNENTWNRVVVATVVE